jgi:YHS domain-containing protein
MMNKSGQLFAVVACGLIAACATPPAKISQEKPVDEINNRQGLALRGYDPVAYFTEKKPTPGRADISYSWKGATYRFATAEHRDSFAASPEHYAPQFGGYCAFAVSLGTTADGDPFQWAVDSDRLFVNNNAIAAKLWNQSRSKNIRLGTTNWPLIPKQSSSVNPALERDDAGTTLP